MESIYTGELAGLATDEQLQRQRAQRQMERERIQAGMKEEAMRQQGLLARTQLQGQQQQSLLADAQKAQPVPQGEPAGKGLLPKPQITDEHKNLLRFIQMAAGGNPQQAEQEYGMALPGSTVYNEHDGSLNFTSSEGHPVHIPAEHVKYVMGMGGMNEAQTMAAKSREEGISLREQQLKDAAKRWEEKKDMGSPLAITAPFAAAKDRIVTKEDAVPGVPGSGKSLVKPMQMKAFAEAAAKGMSQAEAAEAAGIDLAEVPDPSAAMADYKGAVEGAGNPWTQSGVTKQQEGLETKRQAMKTQVGLLKDYQDPVDLYWNGSKWAPKDEGQPQNTAATRNEMEAGPAPAAAPARPGTGSMSMGGQSISLLPDGTVPQRPNTMRMGGKTVSLAQGPLTQPTGGSSLSPVNQNPVQSGTLTPDKAKAFLTQAGGDKDKARQLAKQAGYTF